MLRFAAIRWARTREEDQSVSEPASRSSSREAVATTFRHASCSSLVSTESMLESLSRWAPLTGVISAVLGVAGGLIEIVTNPPGSDASGKEVIDFYTNHGGPQEIATILFAIAFVFFVFFAGSLRTFSVIRHG